METRLEYPYQLAGRQNLVTPLASNSFPKRPTAHVVNLEKVREQLGVPEVPIRVLDQPEHPPREFSNQPEQLQP
ncbi:hypothetical protein Tco_1149467 [Tanacetum coccineum]